MSAFTADERIALLLSILGSDIAQPALDAMTPVRGKHIQRMIEDYQKNPPTDEEADYVIGDFVNYFEFAVHAWEANLPEQDDAAEAELAEPGNEEKVTYFPKIDTSDDPVEDLNRLHPFQIQEAIRSDHPKTIAIVLEKLTPEKSGQIIAELNSDVRTQVVTFLSEPSTVPAPIVQNVLRTTVAAAVKVESRENAVDQAKVMAEMLRNVKKELRGEMVEKLAASNEVFAESVKKLLYVFDDFAGLSDRDVQKLLGEVQTDFLVVGLQRADPEIVDKLLGNLSSRARDSVIEEMEYKTEVTDEEVETARAELVAVLARLDEAGEISL